jgi:hypothetical protein
VEVDAVVEVCPREKFVLLPCLEISTIDNLKAGQHRSNEWATSLLKERQ